MEISPETTEAVSEWHPPHANGFDHTGPRAGASRKVERLAAHAASQGIEGDWRRLLVTAAQDSWSHQLAEYDAKRHLDDLTKQLRAPDRGPAVDDLNATVDALLNQAVAYAVVLGYSLARTWPGGVEGWVAQATAYAKSG
jgi:hypothetical protein